MADLLATVQGLLRPKAKKGVAGIWLDEHALEKAAAQVRKAGFKKFEAISPFPLHGIDEAMGIGRSFIPWVTFTFGLLGCTFGLWFTWWTSAVDWPLIIGGKPMFSLPAFIPVIFECTILFAALSSVGTLIAVCGLPKVDPAIIDPDLTSHKFALFVPEDDSGFDVEKVKSLLKDLGADEVRSSEF
ncbi:MAG: DUF3341 domain-containing protein [Pseudobdellovibrionaceae bacterium]|nr:DUF3341 domain-containing protein [Bdellovibrionales bacterium]USN47729.1 MAG: DUF3341 domain-containing protein [Pseudobdellovibrionaceae bacterium]